MKKEDEEENSEEDESELEQEIEELEGEIESEEEIFDEDIIEFIPSTKKISTLGKINISEEAPIDLEENLRATTHLPDDEDSFRYGNKKENEESKYQDFNPNQFSNISSVEQIRKKENFREIEFGQSAESRISSERDLEKYNAVKRFDEKDFRKNDFERKEIKYKPLN